VKSPSEISAADAQGQYVQLRIPENTAVFLSRLSLALLNKMTVNIQGHGRVYVTEALLDCLNAAPRDSSALRYGCFGLPMAQRSKVGCLEDPTGDDARAGRDRWFADSALEGGVRCELVSAARLRPFHRRSDEFLESIKLIKTRPAQDQPAAFVL
jgi:hypothetical protein